MYETVIIEEEPLQGKTPTKVVSSNQDNRKPKKSKVRRKIPRDVNKISEKRQKTRKKTLDRKCRVGSVSSGGKAASDQSFSLECYVISSFQ